MLTSSVKVLYLVWTALVSVGVLVYDMPALRARHRAASQRRQKRTR